MEKSAKAKAIGQRGKDTEKQVEAHLNALNVRYLNFAWERLPDARAAGGRLKAQICDYLAWWSYCSGETGRDVHVSYVIEAKEIAHDYRLPRDKLPQIPRMRKVVRAGALGIVIVHHTSNDTWRVIPLEAFKGEAPPSWDLRPYRAHETLQEALYHSTILFPKVV